MILANLTGYILCIGSQENNKLYFLLVNLSTTWCGVKLHFKDLLYDYLSILEHSVGDIYKNICARKNFKSFAEDVYLSTKRIELVEITMETKILLS